MKKRIITIIIGIEAAIIAAVIVFLLYINSDTVKINRQLELAQRYLLEEDYEQAIAAFEVVIEIDPKNAEAYLGLAEAYEATDDIENAVKILERGSKRTDSDEIRELLKEHTEEIEKKELAAQRAAEAAQEAAAAKADTDTANGLHQDIPAAETPRPDAAQSVSQDDGQAESADEPYRSYLKILQDERQYILRYNKYTESSIAFFDIVGDDTVELIYVSVTPESFDTVALETSLNIVTWQNGQAKLIYTGDWDYNYSSGLYYCLFHVKGDKALYSFEEDGVYEYWSKRYCRYSLESNSSVRKETILEAVTTGQWLGPSNEDWNWNTDYTYYGKNVLQEEYKNAENELMPKADAVLMVNRDADWINNNMNGLGNQAMTYEESIDYLEGFIGDGQKAWQQGKLIEGDWNSDESSMRESFMRITNIKGSHFMCELGVYRLYSFDFVGLFDSSNHATLYDETNWVYGEITIDGNRAIVTLQDVPHFYFDQSLSEFMGTRFVFLKQE